MRRNDPSMHPQRWLLKRNIALGIAVLVIMCLVFTFPGVRAVHGVSLDIRYATENGNPPDRYSIYWYEQRITSSFPFSMKLNQEVLCVIFGALGFGSAMVLFRHLFSRKQAMMTAALPVSREKDLLERTKCFAILTLVPSLISFALYPLAAVAYGVGEYLDMGLYAVRCISVLMMEIYGYALGVFCASLCGTVWSTVLSGIVLTGSCEVIWYGWSTMAHSYLNTMGRAGHFDPLKRISPVISMYKGFGTPEQFVWLPGVLAILLLAVLAFFAYRENRPENTGYTLNIRKAEITVSVWVMLFGIAAVMSTAHFLLTRELLLWLCVLLGSIVIWILLRMALDQNIRISMKHWVIPVACLGAAVLVLLGLRFDVTGYNRYLPEQDELKAVEYQYQNYDSVRLEGTETKDAFLQLAEMMRDEAEEQRTDRHYMPNAYPQLMVTYETANGTFTRCYDKPLDTDAAQPLWKKIVESDDFKASQIVPEGENITVSSALPTFNLWGNEFEQAHGFSTELNYRPDEAVIIEALRTDLRERTLENLQTPVVLYVTFDKYEEFSGRTLDYTSYAIHVSDENTLHAVLGDDTDKWIDYANGGFLQDDDYLTFLCCYEDDGLMNLKDWEMLQSPEEAMELYRHTHFCENGLYAYPTDGRRRLRVYSRSQIQDYLDRGYSTIDTVEWDRLPEYGYEVPSTVFALVK